MDGTISIMPKEKKDLLNAEESLDLLNDLISYGNDFSSFIQKDFKEFDQYSTARLSMGTVPEGKINKYVARYKNWKSNVKDSFEQIYKYSIYFDKFINTTVPLNKELFNDEAFSHVKQRAVQLYETVKAQTMYISDLYLELEQRNPAEIVIVQKKEKTTVFSAQQNIIYEQARKRKIDYLDMWELLWNPSKKIALKKKKNINTFIKDFLKICGRESVSNHIKREMKDTYKKFKYDFTKKLKEISPKEMEKITKNLPDSVTTVTK